MPLGEPHPIPEIRLLPLYLCLNPLVTMGRKSKKNQTGRSSQILPATPAPHSPEQKPANRTYLWVLLVVSFAVFSPSLKSDFVNWDDDRNVYENPMVKNFDLKGIFTQNVIGNYNPLSILSFAVEHKLFGMDPMVMHLNNILLHLLCVLFCALIFERLGLTFPFAMLGVALFAWHPLRVESVSWITERKDVLYGVFFLSCTWLYLRNLEHPSQKRSIAIFILFLTGLFAKIQMVTLPLTMLAIDYWKGRPLNLGLLKEKLPHFAASLAFGLIGLLFLREQGSLEANDTVHTGLSRIFIGSYSLMVYLIKWLVPYEMSPLYPYPQQLSALHYLSLPAAIAVLVFVYVAFRRNWRTPVFGFVFFFFNIAFLLQILGAGQGYLADRFTYIAFTGLFFSSAFGLQQFLEKSPNFRLPSIAAAGMYVAILAVISYRQTKIWANSETLWTHVLKYYSNTALPYNNRANHYRDHKQFDLALQDYNEAVRHKAGHATYNSRAKLFFQRNEDAKAIQDYDKAISMMPKAEYYVNRGAAKAKLGRPQEALEDINKGLQIDPNWKTGYLNRSILHNQLGMYDKAIADIDRYLQFEPRNADLWYEGGRCRRALNQNDRALSYYSKAIEINPRVGLFYLERGKTHQLLGNAQAASSDFDRARQLGEPVR